MRCRHLAEIPHNRCLSWPYGRHQARPLFASRATVAMIGRLVGEVDIILAAPYGSVKLALWRNGIDEAAFRLRDTSMSLGPIGQNAGSWGV